MAPRTEKAAKRFYQLAFPNDPVGYDYTDNPAKSLIEAAFALYEAEYNFNCMSWMWPKAMLDDGDAFIGDEPWTVLFRRAMELRVPVPKKKELAEDHDA